MRDAWLKRTREWLAVAEKLWPLPEQEFAGWAVQRARRSTAKQGTAVFVWGEPGSGKSSLIRQTIRQADHLRRRNILAADATEWALFLKECAEEADWPAALGDLDLAICENLQNLSAPQADADHLAIWLDRGLAEGISFILTADRLPSQISGLSARLVNRLQGGLLAGIRPLSDDSQRRLWQWWSQQRRLPLGPPAGHAPVTTVGQLRNLALHPPQPAARRAAGSASPATALELIADEVAREFHVGRDELCSGSRTQHLKIPRGVAMSLARELTRCPLTTIGRYFGCRSHSAVVRNCSRLQQLLPEAPSLRQQVQLLRAKVRHELSAECG